MEHTDSMGDALYAEKFRYSITIMIVAAVALVAAIALFAQNMWLVRRPPIVQVVRMDQLSEARALMYQSRDYTPQEGEIRSALWKWATNRYRLLTPVLGDFKDNYFFLDTKLSKQINVSDADVVAKVQAGTLGEQDVKINNISFRSFDKKKYPNGQVGSGEAVIDMFKIFNAAGPEARQHWVLT